MKVRLIVFARLPIPGQAKTRLIPHLGAAGAAKLQDRMTRHTLAQAAQFAASRAAEIEIRYTGGDEATMRNTYGEHFLYTSQGEGDLGQRLTRAAVGDAASATIITGTDCPGITAELFGQALDQLESTDVVIGPAKDGGYYLIGMRRPQAALFSGISWSTDQVLKQTVDAAKALGLTHALLPALSDVDVAEDLRAYPEMLME